MDPVTKACSASVKDQRRRGRIELDADTRHRIQLCSDALANETHFFDAFLQLRSTFMEVSPLRRESCLSSVSLVWDTPTISSGNNALETLSRLDSLATRTRGRFFFKATQKVTDPSTQWKAWR